MLRLEVADADLRALLSSCLCGGGGGGGGARPQTAEIIKTFGEKCPAVRINNKADKADYVVLLDHEGGKGWIRKDNKVAVFDWDGDSIVSKSTRSVGSSVDEACRAIEKHWSAGGAARIALRRGSAAPVVPAASKQSEPLPVAKLDVASTPAGADIEVDGSFVGNTPSLLELPLGEHTLLIKKPGFKPWERKLKATGGTVNIRAELEPAQ